MLIENCGQVDYLEQSYREQIDQLNADITKGESEMEEMEEEFKKAHLDHCHQLEINFAKLPKGAQVVNDEQQEQQIK